jgi:hypothetical protein
MVRAQNSNDFVDWVLNQIWFVVTRPSRRWSYILAFFLKIFETKWQLAASDEYGVALERREIVAA